MATCYLTSSFDNNYEIQTGGANLNQYFWFLPHHCRSNVANEFYSIFHRYAITLWLFENKFVWWGIFSLTINHSFEKVWWFRSVLFWVSLYGSKGLKSTTCILGANECRWHLIWLINLYACIRWVSGCFKWKFRSPRVCPWCWFY